MTVDARALGESLGGTYIDGVGTIVDTSVTDEMSQSFLEYALSVIVARALPDARDGLKPVQRRILYAMSEMGFRSERPHRKSAATVGEVIKTYHPHGDAAVYETLVRMAQGFSLRLPLIDGHGNFGGLDTGAAAARYTEARLAPAGEVLLSDVDEATVDMSPNFDASATEPSVLPAGMPNLLVNGASGIAVGLATSIPSHNLGEVAAAVRHVLDHPDATSADLAKFVPGPDFPTGGIAYTREAFGDAYATGRGTAKIRARVEIGQVSPRRQGITVTELPPSVGPEKVIAKVKELVNAKKLVGISDIRDLSDRRNGLRLVIEIRAGFDPQAVLDELYRTTPLEDTVSINMVALVDGKPVTCSLADLVRTWVNHRLEVVRRRSEHRLAKAARRAKIVAALLAALDNIDRVVKIIRSAADTEDARTKLRKLLKIDDEAATHILDMPLRRLTALEKTRLVDEGAELAVRIAELEAILADEARRRDIVAGELDDVVAAHGTGRRTTILDAVPVAAVKAKGTAAGASPAAAASPARIADEPCAVWLGVDGRLGRTSADWADAKRRNPVLLTSAVATSTHGKVAAITTTGRWHTIDVVELPVVDAAAPGRGWGGPVGDWCDLDAGETVVAVVAATDESPLTMVTASGSIKRLKHADAPRKPVDAVISLTDGDTVVAATCASDEVDVVIVTSAGQLLRMPASSVRPQGRAAGGMAGIRLGDGDQVLAVGTVARDAADGEGGAVGVVTDAGHAKVSAVGDYPAKGRGTGGVRAITLRKADSAVAAAALGPVVVGLTGRGSAVDLGAPVRRDASGAPTEAPLSGLAGAW